MKKIRYLLPTLLVLLFSYTSLHAQVCATPLNGGTLAAWPSGVCPVYYFSLVVSGSSTGTGLSYQWESSTDNVNWTTMDGLGGESLTTRQTATTWYRRKMICESGGTAYSGSVKVTTTDFNTCYCTPGSADCSNYRITNVSFGTINNNSACSTNGYTNYTGTVAPANIQQGSYLPISITAANAGNGRYIFCYIDFNQNGQFDPKEGTMLFPPTGNVYSGFIKVPFHTPLGLTRMRIMYRANSSDPCSSEWNSETEDYAINLTPNATNATGHVIYVKPAAAGSNYSGLSWANARTSLRDALQIATSGDTIKVAEGTYFAGTSQTNGILLDDSITLLAGYPNTGTPANASRNSGTHPVILSGYTSSSNTAADFHVLFANGIKDCTVDGFIIQDGGTYYSEGSQYRGGGISLENSSGITIRNCVFRNNYPFITGSAISVWNTRVAFENCIVTKNNNDYYSIILVQNNSQASFTNLLAAANGGSYLFQSDSSKLVLTNSTLARNTNTTALAGIFRKSQLSVSNSISYYNRVYNPGWQSFSFDSSEISQENSTINYQNSLTQVYNKGSNLLLGASPKFRDTSSIAGADGFFFTADDGYSLVNPCSPAMNAGSNADANGITTDILGKPRIFGARVDLGAYEVQQDPTAIPKVIYVNAAATGANNGSSWANAFTDLHQALQMCSDTIKVAAGTYTPWKNSNPGFYWIENKRVLLGSYPASGNPANANRNYELYPTVIDASTNTYEKAITLLKGINLDSTSLLDGFRFSGAGKQVTTVEGAVVYRDCNNPVISNCSFTGNFNRVFFGKNNKNPLLINCTVNDNQSAGQYQLNLVALANCEKTTFRKCIFRNNNVNGTGIMELLEANALVDSCLFLRNYGTMMTNTSSAPTIINTAFLNNYGGENTIDVRNNYSSPVFTNCVFTDSMWAYASPHYGGMLYNYISSPVFNNCRFSNGRINQSGGVAFNDSSLARFNNCVFANNMNAFYNANSSNIVMNNCISYGNSGWYGMPSFMFNQRSSPVLNNCTVVNSTIAPNGVMVNDYGSNPRINNSIFWRNFVNQPNYASQLSERQEIINRNNSYPVIHNSMLELYDAGAAGDNTTNVDPRFKNYENPIGQDSTWFTADDGLQLCDCSGAINSGSNELVQQSVDIKGAGRIFNNTVDRGAYELQVSPGTVYHTSYVNASAAGNGSGKDWANAYTSLTTAVYNPCTDTIKIAAGIYKPAVKDRDSGFYLNRNMVMLGSYDASTGAQDVDAHPSILSGDLGIAGEPSDNSYGLVNAYYFDSLVMDGLVLRDVNRTVNGPWNFRGGLSVKYLQRLSLTNCRFYNNITNLEGGAMFAQSIARMDISKTVFGSNKAVRGGGIYFIYIGPTHITQTVFENNEGILGGGLFTGQYGTVYDNCLFAGNHAEKGGGMLLDNNPDCIVTNCTFSKNYSTGSYGGAIYSEAYAWQGGGPGPDIGNCIFTNNSPGQSGQSYYQDIYYPKYGYPAYGGRLDLRIHHSAASTESEYYYGNGMIGPNTIVYKNPSNPKGADGKYFTLDDGYQLAVCSGGVDKGKNDLVKVPQDLAATSRIVGIGVDMGSYEFNGQPQGADLLTTSGDTLLANKEFTDSSGWTHYFKDCRYLMSIKKEGQDIGTVGDSTFRLKVITTSNYGTGKATNLTAAAYNTTGLPWYVMNRYWNIIPTHEVIDSIRVRFPYTSQDYNDVVASNPSVHAHTDLQFFKVTGTTDPLDLSVPASNFYLYQHTGMAGLHSWSYGQQDSNHLAEYYVSSFSGGGGGALYNGPLPDLSLSAVNATPATISGGEKISLSFTELNASVARASAHELSVYLSTDSILTPGLNGDTLLLTQSLTAIDANASKNLSSDQVRIPCGIAPGHYYLLMVTDAANNVVEAREDNNMAWTGIDITVSIPAPSAPVVIGEASGAICYGTTTTLSFNPSDCPSCDYTWSTGSKAVSITVGTAGTYTLTATNGCGTASSSYTLTIKSLPWVTVNMPASTLCLGNTAGFTASGADTYSWTGESLSATSGSSVNAHPARTGVLNYAVTGTANGCSATKNFTITVLPLPILTITPANPTICSGGSVTLHASGADGFYAWTPSTGLDVSTGWTVVARPVSATTYTVSASTLGCVGTASTTVTLGTPLIPGVSITNNGCTGNSTSFTATPVNGGADPHYQWYVNNTPQGTGSTLTLTNANNGTQVYVVMTPGALCLTTPTATSPVLSVNCTTTAIPGVDGLESFSIAPNPTSGMIAVTMKLQRLKNVSFIVTDGNGRIVYQSVPGKVMGSEVRQINLTRMPQGVYYLQTRIGNERFVEKIIVAR